MDVMQALQAVRDCSTPFEDFLGALEYVKMYTEGCSVVHYCGILEGYVYIGLSDYELRLLDLLG